MTRARTPIRLLLVSLLLAACPEDPKTDPSPDAGGSTVNLEERRLVVDEEGGTLSHPTGAALVVPSGALGETVELTMAGADAPSQEAMGAIPVGQGFVLGPEGQTFLQPVEVVVPFERARLPAGTDVSTLRIMIAPRGSDDFVALETRVDAEAQKLYAKTLHFSQVAPAAPTNSNPVFITTSATLSPGEVGTAYAVALRASGGTPPYSWSGTGLPAGLAIDGSELIGTPTVAGAFTFSLRATDAAGQAVEKAFSLVVNEPPGNPAPTLVSVSPDSAVAGSAAVTVALIGVDFVEGAKAHWDSLGLPTTFVSATRLSVEIPSEMLASAGIHQIRVANPPPGGGESNAVEFCVESPVPVLARISPDKVAVGDADLQIALYGSGFVPGSMAAIAAQGLSTVYVSSEELAAIVPAAYRAQPGTLELAVFNPEPGGGYSGTVTLWITESQDAGMSDGGVVETDAGLDGGIVATDAGVDGGTVTTDGGGLVPTITLLDPNRAPQWSPATAVWVTGTNFNQDSVVYGGAEALGTQFLNDTMLIATIPVETMAISADLPLKVVNPGSLESNRYFFQIDPRALPSPTVVGVMPPTIVAGAADTVISVSGEGFVYTSEVVVDGVPLATNYLGWWSIEAVLPSSLLASPAYRQVVVRTPGAGDSSAVTLEVGPPVPEIQMMTPGSFVAGDPDTEIVVVGTGFAPNTVLRVEQSDIPTTYVSETELHGVIPAAHLAARANLGLYAYTPAPGGGLSRDWRFVVAGNAVPAVTSLTPDRAPAGSGDVTVTVDGTEFAWNAHAQSGQTTLATTFVSDNQLQVVLPAALLAAPGTVPITVINDPPGGGSATADFTVEPGAGNPLPVVDSTLPYDFAVGSPESQLTVYGQGFVAASTAFVGTTELVTTFVSATELRAVLPASLFEAPGDLELTVYNPPPGGGTSAVHLVQIFGSARPVIRLIDPEGTLVGAGDTQAMINGSGFDYFSRVFADGTVLASTFYSESQILVTIPAAMLNQMKVLTVSVVNDPPGGGTATHPFKVDPTVVDIPVITSVDPSAVGVGSVDTMVVVDGANFIPSSQVLVDGQPAPTSWQSTSRLLATVPASLLAEVGERQLWVSNPGAGDSANVVLSVGNPVPVVLSTVPSDFPAGAGDSEIVAHGEGFVPDSIVRLGGLDLVTTYISGRELRALVPASLLVQPGALDLIVYNPPLAGGTSGALSVSVLGSPAPEIWSLDPGQAVEGAPDTLVYVSGAGFTVDSSVFVDQTLLASTFDSSSQLRITLPASLLAAPGSLMIEVVNPAPGGGSATAGFTIDPVGVPMLTEVQPTDIAVGSADFMLTIGGTGFAATALVTWDGTPLATAYVSATRLTATVPAGELATAGVHQVGVRNPAPGGDSASTVAVSVENPFPVIAGLLPASLQAGSRDITIAVEGSGFVAGSVVRVGAQDLATTYVHEGRLQALVPEALLAVPASLAVTVVNPSPGGGQSEQFALLVEGNPVPQVLSVSPDVVAQWSPDTRVTLAGSGFVAGTRVVSGATALSTTLLGDTSLEVVVPAALLAGTGPVVLTVINDPPGGGSASIELGLLPASAPTPHLASITPPSTPVDAATQTLRLKGESFVTGATVFFGQTELTAVTLVDPQTLEVELAAADHPAVGSVDVTVANPGPGNVSNAVAFEVTAAGNPVPHLDPLEPSVATIAPGSPDTILALRGANFLVGSVARADGVGLDTSFRSSTELSVVLPASMLAVEATLSLTVENPAPGGGASNAVSLSVSSPNPVPVIAFFGPASAAPGSADLPFYVNMEYGTKASSGVRLLANGADLTITEIIGDSIFTNLPASLMASVGTVEIVVVNPAPGGGPSAPVLFEVTDSANPLPVLASITPSSFPRGAVNQQLLLEGQNFHGDMQIVSPMIGSTVSYGYSTSTQFTLNVMEMQASTAGTFPLLVQNPAPGGGRSQTLYVTVTGTNPAPQITGTTEMSEKSSTALLGGSSWGQVTLEGSDFLSGTTVSGTGNGISFESPAWTCSPTSCSVSIPAEALAAAGPISLTMNNPAPGGGSASVQVEVTNPVPVITAVTTSNLQVGVSGQKVWIYGSGFCPETMVVDTATGTLLPWTMNGTSYLVASVPDALVAAEGTLALEIVNPAPGGGSVAFSVPVVQVPNLTGLDPATVAAGSPSFELIILGDHLDQPGKTGTVVVGKNALVPSSYGTSWTVTIPDWMVASPNQLGIAVQFDGEPASNAVTLTVQ